MSEWFQVSKEENIKEKIERMMQNTSIVVSKKNIFFFWNQIGASRQQPQNQIQIHLGENRFNLVLKKKIYISNFKITTTKTATISPFKENCR